MRSDGNRHPQHPHHQLHQHHPQCHPQHVSNNGGASLPHSSLGIGGHSNGSNGGGIGLGSGGNKEKTSSLFRWCSIRLMWLRLRTMFAQRDPRLISLFLCVFGITVIIGSGGGTLLMSMFLQRGDDAMLMSNGAGGAGGGDGRSTLQGLTPGLPAAPPAIVSSKLGVAMEAQQLRLQNQQIRQQLKEMHSFLKTQQTELDFYRRDGSLKNKWSLARGPTAQDVIPSRIAPAGNPWVNRAGQLPTEYPTKEYYPLNSARRAMLKEWEALPHKEALRYWDKKESELPPRSRPPLQHERFLTLEWYNGGFNNIRHSIELACILGTILGRTVVLPPASIDSHRNMNFLMHMLDYYNRQFYNAAVPVIEHEEFLRLIELGTFQRSYPPTQQRPFAPQSMTSVRFHDVWNQHPIAEIAKIVPWNWWGNLVCLEPPKCPIRGDDNYAYFLRYRQSEGTLYPRQVDDEMEGNRPRILHFPQTLFGIYYRVIFLDPQAKGGEYHQRVNRLVRDHVVFHPATFAYAARQVKALGGALSYDCLHIRRGDWILDKKHVTPPRQIADHVKKVLAGAKHVYIATNEPDVAKFKPIADELGVTLHFLSMDVISGGDPMNQPPGVMIPNIDQVVCSRARRFVGTWLSTYTGYIQRLRGYYRDTPDRHIYYAEFANELGVDFASDGHDLAEGPSWATRGKTNPPLWAQESEEGWYDLQDPITGMGW